MLGTDVDYFNNCVLIDGAGFQTHMIRSMGWSRKGEPAVATVPTQRTNTVTILGAIHSCGIVNMMLRKLKASKTRKVGESSARMTVGTTTSDHFQEFVQSVMDILDKAGLHGLYLVMDNASIHHSQQLQKLVDDRGFKCLYLPPYSPFLNPIEECWAKMKANFKRTRVTEKDTLSNKVQEAAISVTQEDLHGWIRHATDHFPLCLEKVKDL